MKRLLTAILTLAITLSLFGCEEKPTPEIPEETIAETEITTAETTSAPTAYFVNKTAFPEQDVLCAYANAVDNNEIQGGICLNDMDSDGVPELLAYQSGEGATSLCDVYTYADGFIVHLGTMLQDRGNRLVTVPKITLYYDREKEDYFYVGESAVTDKTAKENYAEAVRYDFADGKMTSQTIARCDFDYADSERINITSNTVMGEKTVPVGVVSLNDMTSYYEGLAEYLEAFTRVSAVELNDMTGGNHDTLYDNLYYNYYFSDDYKPPVYVDSPIVSDEANENIRKAMEFITEKNIGNGALYDFDRDGVPEIVEQYMGHSIETENVVFKLIDGKYREFGRIASCTYDRNEFSLYRDKSTGEYFHTAVVFDDYWHYDRGGILTTYKYVFTDEGITATELGSYRYSYQDVEEGKVERSSCRFMGKDLPELDGIYPVGTDIGELTGLTDYLAQFEEIYVPNFTAWENRLYHDEEERTRNILAEYFRVKEQRERVISAVEKSKNNSPGMFFDFDLDGVPEHIFFDRSMDFFESDMYDMASLSRYDSGEMRYMGDVYFYCDTEKKQMYLELCEDENNNPVYFGQRVMTAKNYTTGWLEAYSFENGKLLTKRAVTEKWESGDKSGLKKFGEACEKELSKYKKVKTIYVKPDWNKFDGEELEISYGEALKESAEVKRRFVNDRLLAELKEGNLENAVSNTEYPDVCDFELCVQNVNEGRSEWIQTDFNGDGFDDLILQDKSKWKEVCAIFSAESGKLRCRLWDYEEPTDYYFFAENGNFIRTFTDNGGKYPFNATFTEVHFKRCGFNEYWGEEYSDWVSVMEVYDYDVAKNSYSWAGAHPSVTGNGIYYSDYSRGVPANEENISGESFGERFKEIVGAEHEEMIPQWAEASEAEPLESITEDGRTLSVFRQDNKYDFVCTADGKSEEERATLVLGASDCVKYSENGKEFLVVYGIAMGHGLPATVVTLTDGRISVLSEYSDYSEALLKLYYYPQGGIICKRGASVTGSSNNAVPYHWDGVKKDFVPYELKEISPEELKALDRNNIVPEQEKAVSIYRRGNGLVHVNYSGGIASRTFVETENGLREYVFETDAKYGFFLEWLSVTE